MGWRFPWVSSLGSSFNDDYHVTFSDEERETETAFYNYRPGGFPMSEALGLSAFVKDDDGAVYHRYSCYARGFDAMIGTYQFLDLTAKGRDKTNLTGKWHGFAIMIAMRKKVDLGLGLSHLISHTGSVDPEQETRNDRCRRR